GVSSPIEPRWLQLLCLSLVVIRCQPLRRALGYKGGNFNMGDRDEYWNSLWNNYYDSYYYSILFSELTIRAQWFDFLSKLLVAVTASGSAIAGWALWENPDFKIYWVIIAGSASFISIVHTTLNISEKLKCYIKLSNQMSEVRMEYESLKEEVTIYSEFNVDEMHAKSKAVKDKYIAVLRDYAPDFLSSKKLQNKSQDILNDKLGIKE
ncbi:TPA: hypothetical protein ACGF3Q_003637, partial [Vibrio cholerae]